MVAAVRERVSRRALISFATNYNSASEAIMELVDNPLDYRGQRRLHIDIDIDKRNDRISVRDYGGQGMDRTALEHWLDWGGIDDHAQTDIGQFHVGGKLAAMYLADEIQIACRAAGDGRIWSFSDPEWGGREHFDDAVQIEAIESVSPYTWLGKLEHDAGFVQLTLAGLKQHGFDEAILSGRITDTYETLLERGDVVIRVNGSILEPYALPWLDAIERRTIPPTDVGNGVIVDGFIAALERRQLPQGQADRVQPGIRTTFNGRKISDGETFGINLGGRGTSQRLFGEIGIAGAGFRPNQNKTAWDVDSQPWGDITEFIVPTMREVLDDLNALSGKQPKDTNAPKRKKYRLSFMLQWLNEGYEREEAQRVEQAARESRLSPKAWVRKVVRRALLEQDPDIVA